GPRRAGGVAAARLAGARGVRLRPLRRLSVARRPARSRRLPRADPERPPGVLVGRGLSPGQTLGLRARRASGLPGRQRRQLRGGVPERGYRDALPEPLAVGL